MARSAGKRGEAKRVLLVFRPMSDDARGLAEKCQQKLTVAGHDATLIGAPDLGALGDVGDVSMVVTFGGDGTIIRAARCFAGTEIPILGVAMGKLGFLTELSPDAACDRLPEVLDGGYWKDERLMLGARVHPLQQPADVKEPEHGRLPDVEPLLALNEVVIGRGASPKVVDIDVMVDGVHLVHYVADGIIVSTPTGSTAYALSAGGPVVAPGVEGVLLVPLAPHLAVLKSLVVPVSARIDIRASSEQPTLMVLDGQEQIPLRNNQQVTIQIVPERTIFARTGSRASFYETLVQGYNKKR